MIMGMLSWLMNLGFAGGTAYTPPTVWFRVDCGTLFTAGAVGGQDFVAGSRCGSISHGA